ncbi:DNA repair protein RadC [Marinihelvus fidelis]|uniref:DNA repair protein RadC n=1 Tax=Marinihelvus fidelis TaxID=2613842 RepID=A0A5N0TAC3_9GAMM|nr:DNA repair protein RadC [Marinihelvus fidelis]KAA9131638.1 DNA repair protein RadC [Marinihelvus fidelis]
MDTLPPQTETIRDAVTAVPLTAAQPPGGNAGDAELLARFLGMGAAPPDIAHCRRALRRFKGLRGLLDSEPADIARCPGFGAARATQLTAGRELFRRQLEQQLCRGRALTSPAETVDYLRAALRDRRREIFTGLFLDTRHRVIACEELFQGSIDGACVYPRVVAEKALRHAAAAVIVAHNHPSGVTEPSLADQAITRRLKDALGLLEIRLLDHFVIGEGEPVSMASRGML